MGPKFKPNKRFKVKDILQDLRRNRKVIDGKVFFNGFDFQIFFPVLDAAFDKRSDVSEWHLRTALKRSLLDASLSENFLYDDFLKCTAKHLSIIENSARMRYRVYFDITNITKIPIKRIAIGDASISFPSGEKGRFVKKARTERQTLRQSATRRQLNFDYHDTRPAIVSVCAADAFEAEALAEEALDQVRGLLNFLLNRVQSFRISMGNNQPVNRIICLPLITVHDQEGALYPDNYWYIQNWEKPQQIILKDGDPEKLKQWTDQSNKRLRSQPLGDFARIALGEYCRSLDKPDWEASFLKIWSLLERLTNAGEGGRSVDYDILIRRASAAFQDRSRATNLLEYMRRTRHKIVHESAEGFEAEALVYHAKRPVEVLLDLYLRNSFKLKSVEEVCDLLDAPDGKEELNRRLRLLKHARAFHNMQ